MERNPHIATEVPQLSPVACIVPVLCSHLACSDKAGLYSLRSGTTGAFATAIMFEGVDRTWKDVRNPVARRRAAFGHNATRRQLQLQPRTAPERQPRLPCPHFLPAVGREIVHCSMHAAACAQAGANPSHTAGSSQAHLGSTRDATDHHERRVVRNCFAIGTASRNKTTDARPSPHCSDSLLPACLVCTVSLKGATDFRSARANKDQWHKQIKSNHRLYNRLQ